MYAYLRMFPFWFLICLLTVGAHGLAGQPTAREDVFTAIEGQPLLLDLIANDSDDDGDPLVVMLNNPAQPICWGKTLNQLLIDNGDGSFILQTPSGVSASCNFTYRLAGMPQGTQVSVTIHITPSADLLPNITQQPSLSQAKLTETGMFSVQASSTYEPTYQWKKDGVNLIETEGNSRYVGVNSPTLHVNDIIRYDIGSYQCEVSNAFGTVSSDDAAFALVTHLDPQAPFDGNHPTLPAVIEAEFYDFGPVNEVFHDTTADNSGAHCRTGDPDIGRDAGGDFYLTDIVSGEWVQHSFLVDTETRFNLLITAAADANQAPNGIGFSLEIDGNTFACQKSFPATGGAEIWQTFMIPAITLEPGVHQMRFIAETDGWNLNRFEFVSNGETNSTPFTSNGFPHGIGVVQFEHFDYGGSGIAYHNTTPDNQGSYCGRLPDLPDLYQFGSRIHLGNIKPGEWLNYTVDIPAGTQTYDLILRYTSNAPGAGTLLMEIPEDNFSLPITIPENQADFTEMTVTGINLNGGTKKLKFSFPNPNYGLDYFELKSAFPPVPLRVATLEGTPISPNTPYSMGDTLQNQELSQTFTLFNDHPNQTLYISNFHVSGSGWSSNQPLPQSIPAQASANFTIQLLSAEPLPSTVGTISFDTSGANGDGFLFQTSGIVNESIIVLHAEYLETDPSFIWKPVPNTAYFSGNNRKFRIRNGGNITISGQISLLNNQYFSFFNEPSQIIPFSLPPEGQGPGTNSHIREFWITYNDGVPGENTATVDINSDHPNGDSQFMVQYDEAAGDPISFAPQPVDDHLFFDTTAWVQFSTNAHGGIGNLEYTWEYRKDAQAHEWAPIDASGPFPNFNGQNSPTVNIQIPADLHLEHNRFRCLVVDASQPFVKNTSNEVQINFHDPIQVTLHPENQLGVLGQTFEFLAEGEEEGHTSSFQWQFRSTGSSPWSDLQAVAGQIAGVQTSKLELLSVNSQRIGFYRCKIYEPTFPDNEVYTNAGSLSLITGQPADAFSFGKADFQVAVETPGTPVTYQWFANSFPIGDGGQYQGTQTSILKTDVADTEFNTYHCLISTGGQQIESWPAQRRWLFGGGTQLADTFRHGQLHAEALNGTTTPYGDFTWSSSSELVHRDGHAFEKSGNFTDAQAKIPFFPPANTRLILQTRFALDLADSGNWMDLGFYNQNDPAILIRVRQNGAVELYHEDQLIGSGTGTINTSFWRLEIDQTNGAVSVSDGSNLLASGTIPMADFPFISRAGFAVHKAQASGEGDDFRVSDLWVRAVYPIAAEDDLVDFDSTSGSGLAGINVLANDHGSNLAIIQNPGPTAEHGTVSVFAPEQTLTYTPDPNFVGWDRITYRIHNPQNLDTSTGFVHIFVHEGVAFSAREDWAEVVPNKVTPIDVLANDYNGNPLGTLALKTPDAIAVQPNNGTVQLSADASHFTYTPNPHFRGMDYFTYRLINEAGQVSLGRVDVVVSNTFDGVISDDFAPVATYRGAWLPIHGKPFQWGDAIWRKTDLATGSNGAPLFFNNAARIHFSDSGYHSSPRTWTALSEPLHRTLGEPSEAEGFEAGNFDAWDVTQDNGSTPQLSLTQTNPLSGQHTMQIELPGGFDPQTGLTLNRVAAVRKNLDEPKSRLKWGFQFRMNDMTFHPTGSFNISRGVPSFPGGPMVQVQGLPSPRVRIIAIDNNGKWRTPGWVDLPAEGTAADLAFEWWSGNAENPLGGVRLYLDGELKNEMATVENRDQKVTQLILGVNHNAHGDFSGKLHFDDFSWQNEEIMMLKATTRFFHASTSEEKFHVGFASHPELAFDDLGQTALYLQLEPGRYEIRQQSKIFGIDRVVKWGDFSHTTGQQIEAELLYHPGSHAVSLRIDGSMKVNQQDISAYVEPHLLKNIGWLFRGQLVPQHRLDHLSYQTQNVLNRAYDDTYSFVSNEIATVDVRQNDFQAQGVIPTITSSPQQGEVVVNTDGTITYKPNGIGPDQFHYAIASGDQTREAQVRISVEPGFSEEIPLVTIHEDNFEARSFSKWTVEGDTTRSAFEAYPAISDGLSYKVTQPGGDTESAYIKHHSTIKANYARIQFEFDRRAINAATDGDQNSSSVTRLLAAYGENQYLFDVRYRPLPSPAIYLTGVSKSGPWTGSGWIPLDESASFQTIAVEWWDNHPGMNAPGMRFWLNGSKIFENLNFNFRREFLNKIHLGVISPGNDLVKGKFIFDDVKIWRSAYQAQFQDGFENGTDAWDVLVDAANKITSNTTDPLSGVASMDIVVPGGDTNRAYVKDSFDPTKSMYIQFKFAAKNVTTPQSISQTIFRADHASNLLLRCFYLDHIGPKINFQGRYPNGDYVSSGWHDLNPAITTNGLTMGMEWWSERTFEQQGALRLLIDGSLAFEQKNMNFSGQELQTVFFGVAGALNEGTSGSFVFDDYRAWIYDLRD